MKKWPLLLAADVILAGGTLGEATAQPKIAVVQEAVPPSVGASCARPSFSLWHRCTGRFEKWSAFAKPDIAPLGQSLYQTMTNQIDSGIAVRMILNDFDFEPNGANLNFRGQEKLPRLVALAMQYPYFITVERTTYDPGLADLRRQAVVKVLARMSNPVAADRVVVAGPLTPGLSGVEAELIYQSLLNQTMSGGGSLGTGSWRSGPAAGSGMGNGQTSSR